ncbi:hypothetical protein [Desulforamulus aquiferis]|uniref:Uncharacterized protein n=1 Tax=Desulforamulus aquiferis TaxID=1397668 RepID=A0AAW7ZAM6_9FIRM|nr:hypothetical protein [Desulforamulus aquiferis]MDO7786382.1 hypothetical protein [Desulforamulus aquiferis]
MKLVVGINNALQGNWDVLSDIMGRELYLLTINIREFTFDELWIRAKSLLCVKGLPKPKIRIGDQVVVFDHCGTYRLEKGTIEKKSDEVETCFGYRSWADGRLKMLCSNLGLWGHYPFQLPDFNVQKDYYLKNLGRVENISCCHLYLKCQAEGRCLSRVYEELGIRFNCTVAQRLEQKSLNLQKSRILKDCEIVVESDGQLALF